MKYTKQEINKKSIILDLTSRSNKMTKQKNLEDICMYKLQVNNMSSSTGKGMRMSVKHHGRYSKAYRCMNVCNGHDKFCKMYVEDEYTTKYHNNGGK